MKTGQNLQFGHFKGGLYMRIEYLFIVAAIVGFSACAGIENLVAWVKTKKGGKMDGRRMAYRTGSL